MNLSKIIAAVWDFRRDQDCLATYGGNTVFILKTDLISLQGNLKHLRKIGKKAFVDIDFVDGLSNDEYALRYVSLCGVDGIITVKPKMIELCKKYAIPNVLRSFVIDSNALKKTADTIKNVRPDFLEILPGSSFFKARDHLKANFGDDMPPLIAAGLVESKSDLFKLFDGGAIAVSTSEKELWHTEI